MTISPPICYDVAMNILLTSAGRRTYLVDYFKQALGAEGLVYAANSVKSPALEQADGAVLTPLIYDAAYIPFLLNFCKTHGIGLLVPLFDVDLPVLAAHRAEFSAEGVVLAVSEMETLAACNDKARMAERLCAAGIPTPKLCLSEANVRDRLLAGRLQFPLLLKPRFGMGSIAVERVETEAELSVLAERCRREIQKSYLRYETAETLSEPLLFQQWVEGAEYGLDVVNDFSGQYMTTIVRRKLAMRAGETDEAVVLGETDEAYPLLTELGKKLSKVFAHIGNMDVDVLLQREKDGGSVPYVIDMNARFGGGYPFSQLAGADLPRAYICWAKGQSAPADCFQVKAGVHGYKALSLRAYGEMKLEQ